MYAANEILATNITYTPSDSSWNVNNTASALDNLYDYYETSKYVNQKDCVQGTFVCTDCATSTGQKILDFAPNSIWFKMVDKRIMYFDKRDNPNNLYVFQLDNKNTNDSTYLKYIVGTIDSAFKMNNNLVLYNWSTFYQNQEIYFTACK